jgi:hypothetical protein
MVAERTTRNKGGAARRVGGRAPRSTSKKGKQQEDSSESSEADTKEEASNFTSLMYINVRTASNLKSNRIASGLNIV